MLSLILFLLLFIPGIILLVILYFTGILFLIPKKVLRDAAEKQQKKNDTLEYEIVEEEKPEQLNEEK